MNYDPEKAKEYIGMLFDCGKRICKDGPKSYEGLERPGASIESIKLAREVYQSGISSNGRLIKEDREHWQKICGKVEKKERDVPKGKSLDEVGVETTKDLGERFEVVIDEEGLDPADIPTSLEMYDSGREFFP